MAQKFSHLIRSSFATSLLTILILTCLWVTPAHALCLQFPSGFSRNSYDFGTVLVGSSRSITTTVTYYTECTYVSPATGTLSAPSGFSSNPSSFTMNSRQAIPITLTFAPTSAGTQTGTATVRVSTRFIPHEGGGPAILNYTTSVVGVGYQQRQGIINVTPTSFDFGNVQINATANQILTVSNTGDATLTGNISMPC